MAAAIGRHPKLAHVAQADHTEALPVLARKQHSLCLSLWELANKSQSSVPLQPFDIVGLHKIVMAHYRELKVKSYQDLHL